MKNERVLFLKLVGIFKYVKIRRFQEFLKFIKYKFSICGLYCCLSNLLRGALSLQMYLIGDSTVCRIQMPYGGTYAFA